MLGRALPFGMGAAIGGAANRTVARASAHQADQFSGQLPPRLQVVAAVARDVASKGHPRRI